MQKLKRRIDREGDREKRTTQRQTGLRGERLKAKRERLVWFSF